MHWAFRIAVLSLALGRSALAASEPEPPRATPIASGDAASISITIPTSERPTGIVTYQIQPVSTVTVLGERNGSLRWDASAATELKLTLRLIARGDPLEKPFVAAQVALTWSNGLRETLDVWVVLQSSAEHAASTTKDIAAEVVAVPESAAPNGTVQLRYTIWNNEPTDERLHLHVVAESGWDVVDTRPEQQELLVEAFNALVGTIAVRVPRDAVVGTRQIVRLFLEIVGDPGIVEAQTFVSVGFRGRNRPDAPIVSGTSTFGVSGLGRAGLPDAQSLTGFELNAAFPNDPSSVSFSYNHRIRNELSNFRYNEEPTQISGNVRHAGWDINFGNRVPSSGSAVVGPFVQGIGGSAQLNARRMVAEFVISRPAQFGGNGAGHLVRGRAGWRSAKGAVAFIASDFGRPDGGYTTARTIQQVPLTAEEGEQLEIERAVTAGAPSNRVRGAGIDVEFRPSRLHRFTAQSGGLWFSNAAGARVAAPTAQLSYSLNNPQRGMLNARWRQMPPTLPGVFLSGDEFTTDGSMRLAGSMSIVGRVYENASETLGRDVQTRGEGGSLGVRVQRSARRLEARWNYRDSRFRQRYIRRTVSLTGGLPLGSWMAGGSADVGTQDDGVAVTPAAYYSADLRRTRKTGTTTIEFTHVENNGQSTQRVDAIGSLNIARWELAGGAWITRGQVVRDEPGMWASVGVPVRRELLFIVGVDRASPDWISAPKWRGTLALRKRLSLPLPFWPSAPHRADDRGAPEQTTN